ncbi:MAG: hypothetical protein WA609_10415 [Terriglobales bacterium]
MEGIDDLTMRGSELLEGYLAMASDTTSECEAEAWAEGLIGDAFAEG